MAGIGAGDRWVNSAIFSRQDPIFRRVSGLMDGRGRSAKRRRVGLGPGRRRWVAGGRFSGRVRSTGFFAGIGKLERISGEEMD